MPLEHQVVQQAQEGDTAAFSQILGDYRQRIFGTIYRLTGRSDEVEDIGQEVFLRLYASLGQLRSAEVFDTWLYRLTVNTVYDHLRRKRRRQDIPMADIGEEQLVAADARESGRCSAIASRQAVARETLEAMLDRIPTADRLLLERKEIQGLSLKELGKIYQANENALKVRLFRARKRALEAHDRIFAPAA